MTMHYRLIRQPGTDLLPQKHEPFTIGVSDFALVVGDIVLYEGRTYRVEERRMVHEDQPIPSGKRWPVFLTITTVDLYVVPVVV